MIQQAERGYYTPAVISEFIANWAIRSSADQVLEPSCGDGSFVKASKKLFESLGLTPDEIPSHITGVELDASEARKPGNAWGNIIEGDFFAYFRDNIEGRKKFDAVVGNPPFIRYQNFDEKYRNFAFDLMKKYGFHPDRLTNIWLPFLDLSCLALKPEGRIGMVVPAELFQVNYAAETRKFLSTFFERLTLVTFRHLVFERIQQEVVLLLGERQSARRGIRLIELEGMNSLTSACISDFEHVLIRPFEHSSEKWIRYFLSPEESELLDRLSHDSRISDACDLYQVNVGLVSGENSFFLINQTTVRERNLSGSVTPVIGRTDQVKGIVLTGPDFDALVQKDKRVFLFTPANCPFEQLDAPVRDYIRWGEEQGFDRNYKCRIRKPWYCVPDSWVPDAFLIRQASFCPRMILNSKRTLVTDTLHKVRFLDRVDGRMVTAAFLNTYTLALCETLGRTYGGGVLTFEPGEMRRVRIPMRNSESLDFVRIDAWQRAGEQDKIFEYTDHILLKCGLGLSSHEILVLHNIHDKMVNRRLGRKKLQISSSQGG